MSTVLLFALLGLGQGALIAGIAVAVVVTHRGSGVINLATGAVAMIAGYTYWALTSGYFGVSLGIPAAGVVALGVALAVGAATELVAFMPLRSAPPVSAIAASLGLLLVLQASVVLGFGTAPRQAPSVFPDSALHAGGLVVPVDRFLLAAAVLGITLAVDAGYRYTRFGLVTRAVAQNERAAVLAGFSPHRTSILNTMLASLIAGLLGILAAPIVQVDSNTLPLQIVPALAAALFARFTSLWIACGVGLLIGVCESVMYDVSTLSWFPTDHGNPMPGMQHVLVFAAIVTALLLRGSSLPRRGEGHQHQLPPAPIPTRPGRSAVVGVLVVAIGLVVLPFDFRQATVNTVIGALIVMSYVVITGYAGQVSIMQLALSGTSGFLVAHLAHAWHLPFPVDALLAVTAATVLGVGLGAASLRVRGVSLAIVTLAATVAIEQALFLNTTFGGRAGVTVASPRVFGVSLGPDATFRGLDGNQPSPVFGWLALAVTAAVGVYVANLRRTTLGRRMLAVRSNERAAAAAGISVHAVKMAAVTVSSLIAGVAGVLYGYDFGAVSATRFTAMAALGLVVLAYVGGITRVTGALIAGAMSTEAIVPHALERWFGLTGTWLLLVSGLLLVATLVLNPGGVAGVRRRDRPPATDPAHTRPTVNAAPPPEPRPSARRPVGQRPVLTTTGLSVHYGGVHALSGVDLDVGEGEIVGLIGPNGAGKTTFIDALTGFTPCQGQVCLDGIDITRATPHRRAHRGLARTWQDAEVFDDLTVAENVAVAGRMRWIPVLTATVGRQRHLDPQVHDLLRRLGLETLADRLPTTLPHSYRKLVGVARALAPAPRLICLDEPAAGLDRDETRQLGHHLRGVADAGTAMIVVDHDMGFVLDICDRVVVLDVGEVIASGSPGEVRSDPVVHAAYLGTRRGLPATPASDPVPAP